MDARLWQLVQRASAHPPSLSPEQVAQAAVALGADAHRTLTLKFVELVQALVLEVEVGREQLLDAQESLAHVMRKMVEQEAACVSADAVRLGQEKALTELARVNARLQSQQLRSRRARGGRSLPSAAESLALEVDPTDWEAALDDRQQAWLVAKSSSSAPPSASDLQVSGAAKALVSTASPAPRSGVQRAVLASRGSAQIVQALETYVCEHSKRSTASHSKSETALCQPSCRPHAHRSELFHTRGAEPSTPNKPAAQSAKGSRRHARMGAALTTPASYLHQFSLTPTYNPRPWLQRARYFEMECASGEAAAMAASEAFHMAQSLSQHARASSS